MKNGRGFPGRFGTLRALQALCCARLLQPLRHAHRIEVGPHAVAPDSLRFLDGAHIVAMECRDDVLAIRG